MRKELKVIMAILFSFTFIFNYNRMFAEASDEIVIKDNSLQSSLCEFYEWNGSFSFADTSKLSLTTDRILVLENKNISDVDGLQYFSNLRNIFLAGNNLENLKPLSELKELIELDVSNNTLKGIKFENALKDMGRIEKLKVIKSGSNGLSNIEILDSIGNIENYYAIEMGGNRISDISVLKNATALASLDLSDNCITDVTPLRDLKKLTRYLDLRDNCIIDYTPIKYLLDEMHSDSGNETGLERYDYYKNPVNIKYDGKIIKFPFLTVYYKYQAYVDAIPLLKAFGGSAKYDKKSGILICKWDGNVLVFTDFSKNYTFNGKEKSLKYPMRRMQYDLAYIPVKDVCDSLGISFNVVSKRKMYHNEDYVYAPKLIEIRKAEKELG